MWWNDLLLFLFPGHCLICGRILKVPGEHLCLFCEYQLPRTGFLDKADNPVFQNFWGRIPVEMASSLLRFEKGSAYQQLIHEIKYKKNLILKHFFLFFIKNYNPLNSIPISAQKHRKIPIFLIIFTIFPGHLGLAISIRARNGQTGCNLLVIVPTINSKK